jgi:RNA polymerase sigma factor (TIGR02999 family)
MSELALATLFDQLYVELKSRAHFIRRQNGMITLNTTGLVHEAVIKLMEARAHVNDPEHLLNLAARVMRQVLFNRLEERRAQKRGSAMQHVELDDQIPMDADLEITAHVMKALQRLEHVDARLADIFVLRVFADFGYVDIGKILGVSHTTVQRDFQRARAFLLKLHGNALAGHLQSPHPV